MTENQIPVFNADEFDKWAGSYDAEIQAQAGFPFEGFSAVMDEIVRAAAVMPGLRVLDLGTGTGELAGRFAKLGCQVTGSDFSEEMLKLARRKYPALTFQFQDLRQPWPPELDTTFDRIVSAYVFHHFPLAQKVSLIQEMRRHLNPGGRIVIGDLSFESEDHLNKARSHYNEAWDEELYWVSAEALPALEKAGFEATYRQISYCAGVYHILPRG